MRQPNRPSPVVGAGRLSYQNETAGKTCSTRAAAQRSPQQTANAFQRYDPAEQAQQQISKASAAPAEFRQLIGEENEGTLARFVDNKLNVLFWYRPPGDPQLVFGAQIALPRLVEGLRALVQQVEPALREEICRRAAG